MWKKKLVSGMALAALAGCATAPIGPRVAVMPAPGKPFELFAQEDQTCQRYAEQSAGQPPSDVAAQNLAGSAAAGTLIGAVIGALAGGQRGAAVGAATGLVVGSASGSSQGAYAARDAQRLYDVAYQQCMYSKGNQVPGYAIQRFQPPPQPPPQPKSEVAPYPPPPPPGSAVIR
jgi:predicted lipid-binding transport protein (Tim44 family)